MGRRSADRIAPVILAGGSGTRLWPLSRSLHPKQFLPLVEDQSLIIATCRRIADAALFHPPVIICNREHRFLLGRQLREAGIVPQAIIFEPVARGTAAAAAVAARFVARRDPIGTVLLLAADSDFRHPDAFLGGIACGTTAARLGRIVVFGVAPTRAETGFGYIEVGEAIDNAPGACLVRAFVEKPPRAQAETLMESGRHVWNSGNFLFGCETLLHEFELLRPDTLNACSAALHEARPVGDGLLLDEDSLAAAPADSLDQAIMERTKHAAVVLINAGWSDVGTWDSVWSASAKDMDGNCLSGDVIASNIQGCYVRSEKRLVAVVGVADLVVVETGDAVLVAHRDHSAETKALVERLQKLKRPEIRSHPSLEENWGSFQRIGEGAHFSINRMIVNPGAQFSKQVAAGRAEDWVVACGTASVTVGSETRQLHSGESIHLQAPAVYHLTNVAPVPLHLIEVQTVFCTAKGS